MTIAAVAGDEATLAVPLQGGASAKLVTRRYDGTALTDREGRTPLQLARSRGYEAMVKMLLAAGAR